MARSQPITYRELESGVYVSKTLIAAIAVVGALAIGWLGNDLVNHLTAAASASPRSAEWGSSEIAPVQIDPLLAASSAPVAPPASQSPSRSPAPVSAGGTTNVYLTIVNAPPGAAAVPSGTRTSTTATEPSRQSDGTTVRATAASPHPPGARPGGGARAPAAADGGSQGRTSGPDGQLRARSGRGSSATPTRLVVGGSAAIVPNAPGASPTGTSTNAHTDGVVLNLSPEVAATAIGEHIVIAYDGAIVYVGDNGSLTANSGDAIGGGTVALDAQSSSFSSNYDPTVIVPNGTSAAAGTGRGPSTASALQPAAGSDGAPRSSASENQLAGAGVLAGGSPSDIPRDASPLVSAFISYTGNRTADIAGYEDHSVLTRGTGNVVTYDDSNVFINRNGKINGNTGDTDSAGLNAIATVRSTVSAGPHCDDGCDDESIIQAEAGVFDEGDVGVDGDGHIVWSPDIVAENPPEEDPDCDDPAETNDDGCDDSLLGDNGDDTDAADDESDDGDVSDPAEPAETRDEADSTRPDADNGEEPDREFPLGSLIVGGDGIDDLSERVDGDFNVSTYDDSNVIIGGTGDVNAQIGDSDTGGTVTMDTIDSTVSGGNSR